MEALSREVALMVAQIKRQPGYITGYELHLAADARIVISIWESEEQMKAAFEKGMPRLGPIIQSGRMQLVDLKTCPAEEWA